MFFWKYLDESGGELGTSERFGDREACEEWMGEAWSDLAERGVERVILVDDERNEAVYRMDLGEASEP